jgi:hypothetical protein
MKTDELLHLAQGIAATDLTREYGERLKIIIDQLQVLRGDEQLADDESEMAQRRQRLQTALEQLARTIDPAGIADIGDSPAYRGGAILAFRYAEDNIFGEAIAGGLKEHISKAVRVIRELPAITVPELEVIGGAADLWFFSERPERAAKADVLRAFLCLGLQIQRQLEEYGSAPALLLDWEDDAAYIRSSKGRTVLSKKVRFAQEALIGAKDGHVLVSDDCCRSLSIYEGPVQSPLQELLSSMFSVSDARLSCGLERLPVLMPSRLSMPLQAVVFTANDEMIAGSSSAYVEFTAIEHRESLPGQRRGEQFIKLLATHDECMIVGVTNEQLAKGYLIPALADRRKSGKGFWRRVVVIFPSAEATSRINEERSAEDRLHRRGSGLRTVISFFMSEDPSGESWKVAEYESNLPFVGNWMRGGSVNSIRLSPLLPGCDVGKTFVVELTESTAAYEEAVKAFQVIEKASIEVGEWNLLGRFSKGIFQWTGIVSRSAFSHESVDVNTYEAIVLILVHGVTSRGRKVYLQLRSNLNGSTALGLYSNISGKVTIQDAYDAAGSRMPLLISPEDAEALMSDILREGVLKSNQEVPREVWLRAAIREVYEELGLRVDESRLIDHGHLTLVRPERDTSLFFQIFSLELTSTNRGKKPVAEIAVIRRNREAGGMNQEFTLRDIKQMAEARRLNALLASNLDHFIEIYRELGIPDE